MKRLPKIFFLFILFIFLTTYNPKETKFLLPSQNHGIFNIQNIEVTNNYLVSNQEIKLKLKNLYGKNIFFVKINYLEEMLLQIDLLNKIEVKKKYPNTIKIKIYEEKAIATLNKKNSKFFVMESSKLVPFSTDLNFKNLPSVFGEGAKNHFIYFYRQLEENNFPIKDVQKFYFFQIERWDLQLANDKIIKFPHNNTEDAIKKSIALLDRKDFENYNIIDLRIDGKIIVE